MQPENPFRQLAPAITLMASVACAFAALWHPWAGFIGAALAALTPRRFAGWALLAGLLNGLGLLLGFALWLKEGF